jgi:sugar phosphate isomerase/epimerase
VIAIDRARQLYGDAREHKRAEQQHRRAAQRAMDELRAFCAEYGIDFAIVKTESVEGHGHGTEQEARAS